MARSPGFYRRIHFWAMAFWLLPATALAWVIVYHLPDPHAAFAILLVSNYANFVSHWGAWQAVRAEQQAAEAKTAEQRKG
jgi:hypothetical protein